MAARLLQTLAIVAALFCVAPAAAGAEWAIVPEGSAVEPLDANGRPDTRAGGHPYVLRQSFEIEEVGGPKENLMETVFELPAGLAGDASATPSCPKATAHSSFGDDCPPEARVGSGASMEVGGIYNVTPASDQVAEFVALPSFLPAGFVGNLRASDQGLSLRSNRVPNYFAPTQKGMFELWGVPADHQVGTSIPRRALLTLPTRCDTPPLVTTKIRTWERPDRWVTLTEPMSGPLTGCNSLPFDPTFSLLLGDRRTDAPSGADIALTVPQNHDPDGRASSQVENVEVLLPDGMTVSPGGAAGLSSCSDAQFGKGGGAVSACPAASRVGSVTLHASALGDEEIPGSLYLGDERPGDRFRFFVAADVRGTEVKVVGSLRADPRTGRLTTVLADLPQVPLDSMTLHFDGGPDALLATPLTCGEAKTQATFTPYSGTAPVSSTATVSISGPGGAACAGPPAFNPSFAGGSTSVAAGKATSFRSLLTRKDGEALPARLQIDFPAGMSAGVGAVAKCADAAAASGSCPASSQIGTALAELGPGPDPAQVQGRVFLTGPYRGQPYGLALAFAGKVGPLDLGTMVVRGSLQVDSETGRLSAVIDSLPRVFEGIAVRFQAIALRIDRPGFLSNPTSCTPKSIVSSAGSITGQSSRTEVPFRVTGCVDLPFKPSFALALKGRSQLKQGGKPGLGVEVKLPRGANMRSADIAMPSQLRLDSGAPREICARRKASEGRCSERSRVGTATAVTPLLDSPLKGGIYVAQPKGGGEPDIWAHLEGEGLTLDMKSSAASKDGALHTRFTDLPDLPVAKLELDFDGGRHGLFTLKRGLCRKGKASRPRAEVKSEGHNGARVGEAVRVRARC